jgi:tetratricopeptide (TPR) repeat protein
LRNPELSRDLQWLYTCFECSAYGVQLGYRSTGPRPRNGLGNALRVLGALENSTQRLEEAVTALQEQTHDRMPLQWAGIQNNLGNALLALGAGEHSRERLEKAIAAYRAALVTIGCLP